MSSGRGSSTDASCCAARKMRLSLSSACSSARVDDGRPMTNGIIMCGKTTTSRSGTIGRVSYSSIESLKCVLAGLFDQGDRLFLAHDDLAGDDALADLLLARERVHQVEHEILDDHAQAARPDLPRQRLLRDRLERVVGELQLHVLVLEQLHVLTRDGVARLREDLNQRRPVELVERADDGEAADELGDEAVLDQVFRLHLLERRADVAALRRFDVGLEAERLLAGTALDLLLEADERAAADEQDVGGVDLEEFLVRMLAPALRRNVGDRALEDLQQRLLDPF